MAGVVGVNLLQHETHRFGLSNLLKIKYVDNQLFYKTRTH